MFNTDHKNYSRTSISSIWFVVLIMAVGWSRYLPLSHPELFNFTPVLSLFFISGVFLKGHLSWIGPVLSVFVSDLFLNPNYGSSLLESFTLISIGSYLIIFFLGKSMSKKQRPLNLLMGSIVCALLFHVITCGFAWFVNPAYIKSFGGFWQAQFFGEPGYAPAYLFLRNSIVSTILFSALFSWLFLNNKEKKQAHANSVQIQKAKQST